MTLSEAARKAANRGCDADCSCPECISDEIDIAAARWGLDVAAVQQAGREAKSVATARPSRRGSGNGAAGTSKPRRRKVSPPSDKQLAFIAKLWDEREFESPLAAQVMAFDSYDEEFGGRAASLFIDALMKLPRRGAREREAQQARVEVQLEAGRLYAHGPQIYRVQRSGTSGKLYALLVLEGGGTEYAPGVVRQLDPEALLSLEAAQTWGRKTGTCCNCYAQLTDPKSVERGLGPVCAGKFA